MASTQGRLNDDFKPLRARFHLQQWVEFDKELRQLPPDISQTDRTLWIKRAEVERNPSKVAQETQSTSESVTEQFQHYILNLYAMFMLSPSVETREQIVQQLEQFVYNPEYYNDIILQIYGGLMCIKMDKMNLARDLLGRQSTPEYSIFHNEYNLEKLFILTHTMLTKHRLDLAQNTIKIMENNISCADDILYLLAKMDVLSLESARTQPLPDIDQDTELYNLAQDILAQYGPALRPLLIQASELMRKHDYKNGFNILKQVRSLCSQQGIQLVPEVLINSIHCLWAHSFTSINAQTVFITQQTQLNTMITSLETELKNLYPQHPYFQQKEQIYENIRISAQAANINVGE